jgi:hypothetical protein
VALQKVGSYGSKDVYETVISDPGEEALLIRPAKLLNNFGRRVRNVDYLQVERQRNLGRRLYPDESVLPFPPSLDDPITGSKNLSRKGVAGPIAVDDIGDVLDSPGPRYRLQPGFRELQLGLPLAVDLAKKFENDTVVIRGVPGPSHRRVE